MNRYRQEEFNAFPLESGQNQEISAATYQLFEVSLPHHTHPTTKETSIQIWARWCFGTLVHHLHLLAFQIKPPLFTPTLHLWIYWPVVGRAAGAWTGGHKGKPWQLVQGWGANCKQPWSFRIHLWGLSKSLLEWSHYFMFLFCFLRSYDLGYKMESVKSWGNLYMEVHVWQDCRRSARLFSPKVNNECESLGIFSLHLAPRIWINSAFS